MQRILSDKTSQAFSTCHEREASKVIGRKGSLPSWRSCFPIKNAILQASSTWIFAASRICHKIKILQSFQIRRIWIFSSANLKKVFWLQLKHNVYYIGVTLSFQCRIGFFFGRGFQNKGGCHKLSKGYYLLTLELGTLGNKWEPLWETEQSLVSFLHTTSSQKMFWLKKFTKQR